MAGADALLDIASAERQVLAAARPGPVVRVAIREALHRVLAEPVTCDTDYPPFDRAMMDGFAVRAADVAGASSATPVTLSVAAQADAGGRASIRLGRGQAVRINTGAPIPEGAESVVPIELCRVEGAGGAVVFDQPVQPGRHVGRRAEFVRAGDEVLGAKTRLMPGAIAAAAAAGAAEVVVYRAPRVAVLVTGDELVEAGGAPGAGQIRDSNGPLLEALLRHCHAEPQVLSRVGDDRAALERAIEEGLQCDALCMTGGVSMGTRDLVPDALRACGVEVVFHKVSIKPGKPTLFGVGRTGCSVFALPGNPMSVLTGFWLLVRPALRAREGLAGVRALTARLVNDCPRTGDRQTYRPGRLSPREDGVWQVEGLAWRGSGDPFRAAGADALIVQPPGCVGLGAGDAVRVLPLEGG